eukprot:8241313-Alexandrium_andersonii.AAC.1
MDGGDVGAAGLAAAGDARSSTSGETMHTAVEASDSQQAALDEAPQVNQPEAPTVNLLADVPSDIETFLSRPEVRSLQRPWRQRLHVLRTRLALQ